MPGKGNSMKGGWQGPKGGAFKGGKGRGGKSPQGWGRAINNNLNELAARGMGKGYGRGYPRGAKGWTRGRGGTRGANALPRTGARGLRGLNAMSEENAPRECPKRITQEIAEKELGKEMSFQTT